jgi:glutaredoxin-related protein
MKSINLITLDGCKRCTKLKNILDESSLEYKLYSCTDFPDVCDEVEYITGMENYPIVRIIDSSKEADTFVYLGSTYEELGKEKELNGGHIGIPVHYVDNMLQYINND